MSSLIKAQLQSFVPSIATKPCQGNCPKAASLPPMTKGSTCLLALASVKIGQAYIDCNAVVVLTLDERTGIAD
jgi:hypothetical protein